MKPLIAALLTVAVLASMLLLGSRESVKTPLNEPQGVELDSNPAEEAVRELIRCGDRGDVNGYLDAFSDELKARLEREVAERGREAFANDLRRAAEARKGHAVYAAEPDGDSAARVVVETVYPDRNERQTYRVVKSGDAWRVAEVATARSRQPSRPFGSPASLTASEGTPGRESPAPKVGLTVESSDEPVP
jgi:hypothetical protein